MECLAHKKTSSPPKDEGVHSCVPRRHQDFWDTLSQVPFIPSALREFDRRFRVQSDRYSVFEKPIPRRILTRSYLRRLVIFAMDGGPPIDGLRGYANHLVRDQSCEANTSAYDAAFEQKMIDGGVYPTGYKGHGCGLQEPINMNAILDRLEDQSALVLDSNVLTAEFESFKERIEETVGESQTIALISPLFRGDEGARHQSASDRPFSNLEKIVKGITMAKPDWFYGSHPQCIGEEVRKDLGRHIIPSKGPGMPALPNFFFEAKGSAAKGGVARRQAMHDGAIGARAMFRLQNYRRASSSHDGKAYTLSCTYFDGILTMFATHPMWEAKNCRTTYHMTRLTTLLLNGSAKQYREAIAAYRNARDWTKEQRDAMISEANRVARQASTSSYPQGTAVDQPTARTNGISGSREPSTSSVPQASAATGIDGSGESTPGTVTTAKRGREGDEPMPGIGTEAKRRHACEPAHN